MRLVHCMHVCVYVLSCNNLTASSAVCLQSPHDEVSLAQAWSTSMATPPLQCSGSGPPPLPVVGRTTERRFLLEANVSTSTSTDASTLTHSLLGRLWPGTVCVCVCVCVCVRACVRACARARPSVRVCVSVCLVMLLCFLHTVDEDVLVDTRHNHLSNKSDGTPCRGDRGTSPDRRKLVALFNIRGDQLEGEVHSTASPPFSLGQPAVPVRTK